MIRLKDTKHASTADFFGNAIKIAEYYGFVPLEDALRDVRRPQASSSVKNEQDITFTRREERPLQQIARRVAMLGQGVTSPARLVWRIAHGNAAMPTQSLELHVAGTSSSIAEALLILVASAIAEEAGLTRRVLAINNIGSHESSNRFVRDVGTYLRKHIESISPTLRPRAATDPLGTLVQLIERGHPGIVRAPQAMEYLTEEERRRFWELLEYLEVSDIPYELSAHILGSRDCWSHSLYEISTVDPESDARIPFAFGGRYDPLASRFFGSPVPAATIAITCEIRGKTRVKRDVAGLPSMYFAHLGLDARRRSLPVLETLRKAEIPVYQSLTFERIGEQMAQAKSLAVPYIIVMGYKEATESTVLVREVATNSQEAVPVSELPNYLKRHRLGTWKVEAKA